jgi:uncharacterized protein involved in exopolysaccharide biosynthesis
MQNNPKEYFRIFFRRKWLLIIPTFAGLVIGICSAVIMPKQYESSTKMQITESKTENPLFDKLAVSTTIAQRAKVVREAMLSWDSLVELVKRLKLDERVKSPAEFEELIMKLRERINFQFRDSNIMQVSLVDTDPVRVHAIVKNLTEIFIERNLSAQNKETSDAIRFIEEQLKVYRGKIKSAEIAQFKDRLNELLVDSTEEHPQVRQLRTQIDKKMEELKKENLEYSEDAKLTAEATNTMLADIRKALNSVSTKAENATVPTAAATDPVGANDVYKVMLIDKMDDVMARDVNVNEQIYNSLLQRLETARITQRLQTSKEGTRYTILDPPRVPVRPIRPNPIVNTLAGLALGIMLGGALVFLTEFLDKSFLDVQEAKEFFGTPLLGAISKITTSEIIEEHRQQQVWFLFWMGSAGILLIAFTVMIAAFIKG